LAIAYFSVSHWQFAIASAAIEMQPRACPLTGNSLALELNFNEVI